MGSRQGGGGVWREREGDYIIIYTYRYTVTTRMTPVLRWAAMSAILNVLLIVRDKVTRQCPLKPQTFFFFFSFSFLFWRERRAEAESNGGPSAYQPNALPLGHVGSPCLNGHPFLIKPLCIHLPKSAFVAAEDIVKQSGMKRPKSPLTSPMQSAALIKNDRHAMLC